MASVSRYLVSSDTIALIQPVQYRYQISGIQWDTCSENNRAEYLLHPNNNHVKEVFFMLWFITISQLKPTTRKLVPVTNCIVYLTFIGQNAWGQLGFPLASSWKSLVFLLYLQNTLLETTKRLNTQSCFIYIKKSRNTEQPNVEI